MVSTNGLAKYPPVMKSVHHGCGEIAISWYQFNTRIYQTGELCRDTGTPPGAGEALKEEEKDEEVFISIQAFPALLDVSPSCEIRTVSCGSRHTAAVTSKKSPLTVVFTRMHVWQTNVVIF